MSAERNNSPLWLILALIVLGAIITLIAYLIRQDSQVDEVNSSSESTVTTELIV